MVSYAHLWIADEPRFWVIHILPSLAKFHLQRWKNYREWVLRSSIQGNNRRDWRDCGHQEGVPRQEIQEQRIADFENASPPELRRNEVIVLHKRWQTRGGLFECGNGLHTRHLLSSNETVPQDETDGTRFARKALLILDAPWHFLHSRQRNLP